MPSEWRNGIGRRMLAAVFERADASRWRDIVGRHVVISRSISFYEACGFELDGAEQEHEINDAGTIPIVRLRRPL